MVTLAWSFLRIAVFSVTVLHDDRIVLVAEQRPDASEEDSFQWMSRVLQVGAWEGPQGTGVCTTEVTGPTLQCHLPLGSLHAAGAETLWDSPRSPRPASPVRLGLLCFISEV